MKLRLIKKSKCLLSVALIFTAAMIVFDPTYALAHGGEPVSINQAVNEIKEAQSAADAKDIDCGKITEAQFEELGDAVMESMHPGEQHELMDRMMGGEGSDSLKAAHIAMGQRYLGCSGEASGMMGGYNYGMIGMMGGAINPLTKGGSNMMGNFSYFGFHWFWPILFWLLVILAVVALVKWLVDKSKPADKHKTALDILKERYAKGEISREKFEEMEKDLD